jgi:GT2 family glycosyltransferase
MSSPLVSVIIVTFNNKKMLSFCISSLFKQPYSNLEIIVVDNGSGNGSVDWVREKFPEIKVIANHKNLGFPAAVNQGAAIAKGKYLFFLNDDAVVKNNTISSLASFLEKNPEAFSCQPKILKAGTNLLESTGFYFTWTGFFYHHRKFQLVKNNLEEPKEIFGGTAAALMVERKKFLAIGGFDADFFLYQEDADLSWRARAAGFRIFYCPDSLVYHKISTTAHKLDHSFIIFQSNRNRILVLLKNLENPYLFLILPVNLLILILTSFLNLLILKPKNSLAILAAIGWNLINLKKTLQKRKKIQKTRKVSDKEILHGFSQPLPLFYLLNEGWRTLREW